MKIVLVQAFLFTGLAWGQFYYPSPLTGPSWFPQPVIDPNYGPIVWVPDVAACPAEWLQHGSACYLFVDQPRLKFDDAVLYCRAHFADLASIVNMQENKFVSRNGASVFWIGATDQFSEGWHIWTDGTVFNYANWDRKTTPKGLSDANDCTEILSYTSQWRDADCRKKNAFVCKAYKS